MPGDLPLCEEKLGGGRADKDKFGEEELEDGEPDEEKLEDGGPDEGKAGDGRPGEGKLGDEVSPLVLGKLENGELISGVNP